MAAGMKPFGGEGTLGQMFKGPPKASSFYAQRPPPGSGPGQMPPQLSFTPHSMDAKGQASFDAATADYDQAMKDMREDAADYVSEWSNKMAPKPGSTGQARAAPDSMGQLMASTMAPADEGGLYGVPGDPISSIVNLKKKRRA